MTDNDYPPPELWDFIARQCAERNRKLLRGEDGATLAPIVTTWWNKVPDGLEDVQEDEEGISEQERKRRYFDAAVVEIIREMANTGVNRNITLNALAYRLGRLAAGLGMPVHEAAQALFEAARTRDTDPTDPFTPTEIKATIKSGIQSGMKKPIAWSPSR